MLSWKLCTKGGVVGDVVDHRGSVGLGVYQREEGEETINIKQTNAHRCMAWQHVIRGVP